MGVAGSRRYFSEQSRPVLPSSRSTQHTRTHTHTHISSSIPHHHLTSHARPPTYRYLLTHALSLARVHTHTSARPHFCSSTLFIINGIIISVMKARLISRPSQPLGVLQSVLHLTITMIVIKPLQPVTSHHHHLSATIHRHCQRHHHDQCTTVSTTFHLLLIITDLAQDAASDSLQCITSHSSR